MITTQMYDFMKMRTKLYQTFCEKYIDDPNKYNQELSSNSKAFTKKKNTPTLHPPCKI